MKNTFRIGLIIIASLAGGQMTLAKNIIRVPFSIHPENDPLQVNSPIAVRWEGGEAMIVEIYRDKKIIFPIGDENRSVASDTEFKLDHGSYQIKVRTPPGAAPLPVSARRLNIWIEVLPEPTEIDLRQSDPGQRSDILVLEKRIQQAFKKQEQAFRKQEQQTQLIIEQVKELTAYADEDAKALQQIQTDLQTLIAKFSVSVPGEGNQEMAITQPLQWLADKIITLEGALIEK